MEDVTIDLTGLAHGGAALGRDADGRVIFVPLTIPGERVRARPVQVRERHVHAELVEIVGTPSPHRVVPRCPHFGACGGCHLQHMTYEAQPGFKAQVVRDQLERVGQFTNPPVEAALPSPAAWQYRNSVSFSPAADSRLGFWSRTQERVVPIDECHIIEPALQSLYQDLDLDLPGLLRLTLRVGADGELLVVFETQDAEPPELTVDFPVSAAMLLPTGESANLIGDNVLWERCAGRPWKVSAGSFFQVNRWAAECVVGLVNELAELTGRETVLELHSGVGLLTAGLAAGAERLVGIEANPDAVADAEANLEEMENVEMYVGAAEEVLPALADQPFDLVVLDPPRQGVQPQIIESLLQIHPARLVYVSCDPATFARDARRLARGGYRLMTVRPVDMFPQTFHIETVSLLA